MGPAEDAGQSPERDAELAQEQRPLDFIGARRHVGHEERGSDAIGGPVGEADASDHHALLGRDAVAHQLVSEEVAREQFGHASEAVVDRASKGAGVVDDPPIGRFRDGQTDGTMPARCVCRGRFGHDPPPFGATWIMAGLPRHVSMGPPPLQNP